VDVCCRERDGGDGEIVDFLRLPPTPGCLCVFSGWRGARRCPGICGALILETTVFDGGSARGYSIRRGSGVQIGRQQRWLRVAARTKLGEDSVGVLYERKAPA
jgi:hypothetical protein